MAVWRRNINLYFAAYLCAVALIFVRTLSHLVAFASHYEYGSHIPLIPLVSAYLIFVRRKTIFSNVQHSSRTGGVLLFLGIISFWMSHGHLISLSEIDALTWATASIVLICISGFVACYGSGTSRRALFPLLFLFLMVPIPTFVVEKLIFLLREGSTSITMGIFQIFNVPAVRNGFAISVPGVTIEIAQECSGIRSTLALLITCLLASYLFLQSKMRRIIFLSLIVPMAVVKNGIRIATLTLLSIYVDPGFLHGRLHHEGGIVFFLLALLLLAPILWLLRVSEQPNRSKSSSRVDTGKKDRKAPGVAAGITNTLRS
ncbi:MAG: exosortase/archaeosortase family protein [Candidatus Acidiferrales bacterium]